MKRLVICGGGSSAHALIPFLKDSIFEVSILTSMPDRWENKIELEYQNPDGSLIRKFEGKLCRASNKEEELIPGADYIVLCMPVHKYRVCLHKIAPYIRKDKEVCIGTVYGQGGFNWMVDEIKREYSLNHIVTFAFGLIPWVCRTIEYGKIGVTYGCKVFNVAAVSPISYFEQINKEFFEHICYRWFGIGAVHLAENFLSLTLSVDNQIIHTSRCYGMYKVYGSTWNKREDVPMFYRDYDEMSARLLADLDSDYSKIRNKIKELYPQKDFSYMLDYLSLERLSYNSCNTDIRESFITSKTLIAIGTPVVQSDNGEWHLDINHRFFMDDIYYGNCIAKWIAEKLGISTPTIDAILKWVQEVRCENIIDENNHLVLDSLDLSLPLKSGVPCYYGYQTIDDIID